MLQNVPPTSQKDRPISFVLDDRATGTETRWVPLVIRPEDLTLTMPTRATVHQTLGIGNEGSDSAWIDSFGAGLPTISIAGHTGWRQQSGQSMDGAAQFEQLKWSIFDLYHQVRQQAIDMSADPAGVKLLFVDELDSFAYEVLPMSFVLRRSKSRPLLMQYNIQLQVVSTSPEVPMKDMGIIADVLAGLGSLGSTVGSILGMIDTAVSTVRQFIAPAAAAVKAFMNTTAKIFGAVGTVVGSLANGVRVVANDLIGVARLAAGAGKNVFDSLSAIVNLPGYAKQTFQQVAAAYTTVFCLLSNSLRVSGKTYQDYSALYGTSNCSSTTGGAPASALANMNVFSDIRPVAPPVQMSGNALDGLGSLSRMDPVLAPMSVSDLTANMAAVSSGFQGFSADMIAYGVSG